MAVQSQHVLYGRISFHSSSPCDMESSRVVCLTVLFSPVVNPAAFSAVAMSINHEDYLHAKRGIYL